LLISTDLIPISLNREIRKKDASVALLPLGESEDEQPIKLALRQPSMVETATEIILLILAY